MRPPPILPERSHVLIELAEDHVSTVQPHSGGSGACVPTGRRLILVAQQKLARLKRPPRAVLLQHTVARIGGRVGTFDRRLRYRIGETEMFALEPMPVSWASAMVS